MLNIINSEKNKCAIETKDYIIHFSYRTPVVIECKNTNTIFIPNEAHSVTTTKHIKAILEDRVGCKIPQNEIDKIVNEI